MAMSPRLLVPRATGFNPKSISGLAGWWDAADSAQFTLNNTDPANPGVSEWKDKSGFGRHAAQSTSGSQPSYRLAQRNGRNTVQFDGTADFLTGPWVVTLTAQSTFAVVSMGSASSWGRPFTQTRMKMNSIQDK
jgi:hypothetical protein